MVNIVNKESGLDNTGRGYTYLVVVVAGRAFLVVALASRASCQRHPVHRLLASDPRDQAGVPDVYPSVWACLSLQHVPLPVLLQRLLVLLSALTLHDSLPWEEGPPQSETQRNHHVE